MLLPSMPGRLSRKLLLALFVTGLGGASAALHFAGLPIGATLNDFFQPGSQPQSLNQPLVRAQNCASCHGFYDPSVEPYQRWLGTMMAQATRDPVFHACLAIANQDLSFAGDLCLRCHTPGGWMEGNSTPTDGSALDPTAVDYDGVTCHVCHRLVDVVYDPGASPPEDLPILQGLELNGELPPPSPHAGQYVLDPDDRRRGPFDLGAGFFWHEWLESPFHRKAALCGTCHDVSNPALSRQPDGSYALNAYDAPHPTHKKRDEFPVERTFSEWAQSDFSRAEIEMGGRFGGNKTAVATCQDCHMPDASGTACAPGFGGEFRNDLPLHDFAGSNSWVLRAVRSLYPDSQTGLDAQIVNQSVQRNAEMVQAAADLHAWVENGALIVRPVNQSGHKLPTGYAEGRRMWINVKFYNFANVLIDERGTYDPGTAVLETGDTRVYEQKFGLDATMAQAAGLPPGESFHFVLNNEVLKDNRIPPRGFSNRGFEAAQAAPVNATYPEQHYWDDVTYSIPANGRRAVVTLFLQTTSREYIEFLRDENVTNTKGQIAYDQWVAHGKSAPVAMTSVDIQLAFPPCPPPIPYGLPTETSLATLPELVWQGTPSATSNDFRIRIDDTLPASLGVLFYSSTPYTEPFSTCGGSWLIGAPRVRAMTFTTNGSGSSGWLAVPVLPGMAGTERYYQIVVRDPASSCGQNFSTALHVDFCN